MMILGGYFNFIMILFTLSVLRSQTFPQSIPLFTFIIQFFHFYLQFRICYSSFKLMINFNVELINEPNFWEKTCLVIIITKHPPILILILFLTLEKSRRWRWLRWFWWGLFQVQFEILENELCITQIITSKYYMLYKN